MHAKAEHGREGTGIELILPTPPNPPHCAHGPALLFERFSQGEEEQTKFFACSASRSRKECPLYVLSDKPWSAEKLEQRVEIFEVERKKRKWYIANSARSEHVQSIRTSSNLQFCKSCSHFILPPDEPAMHTDQCSLVWTNYKSVTNPSALLNPLTANAGNAQYLFDPDTTKFIGSILASKKYTHALCVGTPRIHEILVNGKKPKSMLLDLDDRHTQFYPPTVFQHYNMAANHFFEQDGKSYLKKFLKSAKTLAIIVDPPFGALARVIGNSLDQIKAMVKEISPEISVVVYWIFPYFLSKHIAEVNPTLKMSHYVIEYDNHPVFKKNNSTKSPVRIFTDQDLAELTLPADQYRRCGKCVADVPKEVTHCVKCGGCPPMNRATRHCAKCERCVREQFTHCELCVGCRPRVHHCKTPSVCHRLVVQ